MYFLNNEQEVKKIFKLIKLKQEAKHQFLKILF
jgi:hypothetical protein